MVLATFGPVQQGPTFESSQILQGNCRNAGEMHIAYLRCGFFSSDCLTKSAHNPECLPGYEMLLLNMIMVAVCTSSLTSKGGRPTTSSYAKMPVAQTSTCTDHKHEDTGANSMAGCQ